MAFHRRFVPSIWSRGLAYYTTIKDVKKSELPKVNVTVCGWVRSVRKQKDVIFIDVNDGSMQHSLQLVASAQEFPHAKELNFGCSVLANGQIIESSHSGQSMEMTVKDLQILGECDPQKYPFKARERHELEYIRRFPHLRSRTNSFSSLLRLRHTATMAIHEFFNNRGFLHLHSPILTSSDCEGAGDLFQVKPSNSPPGDDGSEYFGCKAYLTVSGQLHAESVASGMSSVYTFGPTFRAERSHTRRHLSEFYMVEAETVTSPVDNGLQQLMDMSEQLYKDTLEMLLKRNSDDLKLFHDQLANRDAKNAVKQSSEQLFKKLSYSEAIDILSHEQEKNSRFQFEPKWGSDLQSEHERFILVHCGGEVPVFVTDFPAEVKPFYARDNGDGSGTVAAFDLLAPGVGEIVGGTLREERVQVLEDRLERLGTSDRYQWYLDLRRFGSVPHGGFGLGFERLLLTILGMENIRDVTPFPRYLWSCEM